MRNLLMAALCGAFLALAGCSDGGQPRGLFTGYVTDKTEEEVVAKVGKPDSIDTSNPNTPRGSTSGKPSTRTTRTRSTTRPS